MATTRQQALGIIADSGAEIEDHSGATDFHVSLWLPAGRVWECSDTHGLSYHYFSDRPAAWRHLLSDIKQGTRACAEADCETCTP